MGRYAVNIPGEYIGLGLINFLWMPLRKEGVKKRIAFLSQALLQACQSQPGPGVGILAAIFPDPRRIGTNIAWPLQTVPKGGIKELNKPIFPVKKLVKRRF